MMTEWFQIFLRELGRDLSARECVELLATCCSLGTTLILARTKRWLIELLERERRAAERMRLDDRQREFYRQKETVRTIFEASQIAQARTLDELLQNTEAEWSARSSGVPSAPPEAPSTPTIKPQR